jgi:hypothetical protein
MKKEFSELYLLDAHKHCTRNMEELNKSELCGCFY